MNTESVPHTVEEAADRLAHIVDRALDDVAGSLDGEVLEDELLSAIDRLNDALGRVYRKVERLQEDEHGMAVRSRRV